MALWGLTSINSAGMTCSEGLRTRRAGGIESASA